MENNNDEIKSFCIRLPQDLWLFLKQASALQSTSMSEIIRRCVIKYRLNLKGNLKNNIKNHNNILTDNDTVV